MNLSGKTAIVTGASRGIGPYIAKTLADQGVTVLAVARNENGLQKTKLEIESSGGICHIHPFDLADINFDSAVDIFDLLLLSDFLQNM